MPRRRITEVTRRDIRESLSSLNLWGRLDEIEFLERLYELGALPSHDNRFQTAREDIVQHRVANYDWEDDWVFDDARFGLSDGDDDVLLRFLAELLHPVVRSDPDEVSNLLRALNVLLAPDGYRLVQKEQLSGRPIFAATEIPPKPLQPRSPSKHFTEDIRPLVSTVARLAELDGSKLEQEVLKSSQPRLEEPEYDNWDGGTYYHTLTLLVPVDLFGQLGDQVPALEKRIAGRIAGVLRAPDSHHVTSVVIEPSVVEQTSEQLADVVMARSQRPIPHFWAPDQFRLFISHVTSFKQRATALRQRLAQYHISGFVAHEIIDPGELWQREIEAALRSMQAMAALITPDFRRSEWTDQEVGWALASDVEVLPVRRGADPHGFLREVQGIQGREKNVSQVADEIFDYLVRRPSTQDSLLGAVVIGFETSESFHAARQSLRLLERAPMITEALLGRIEVAARSNDLIRESDGVPDRVSKLVRAARGANT
ncbi:MAG: TIR domain-containing protein [Acidobacteria bacterium]|nr:TIR domain-containing protein [Acidobacteriota bacterium]